MEVRVQRELTSSLPLRRQTHLDWKVSICKKCEQPFISKKALRNHMRLANHREKSHGK